MDKQYTFIPVAPGWVAHCDEGLSSGYWPKRVVVGWEVSAKEGGGNRYTPVISIHRGVLPIDEIEGIYGYKIYVDETIHPDLSGQ